MAVQVNAPNGVPGDPVAQPVQMSADPHQAAMVSRGEYLAVAGDCQYCHSIPGGAPFAGGQAVQTPFGDLITPNITSDKKFGIGNWTDAQFWNVMHYGIEPGNSLLIFPRYMYPLMPWQDYNKLSYQDVMALKAYLTSLQPVPQPDRPTQMSFPFTMRAGLLAWRLLFFHNQPIAYDPSWSPQVRNGAFLVQALAHCSECHTPRNLLMATIPSRYLAGGHIIAQSWYAPNITRNITDGIGSWSEPDLFNYLYRDGAVGPGAPYGPMKQVVDDSLSRLPASDVHDIAAYLQTATPDHHSMIPPSISTQTALNGGALYAANCARCHGGDGKGVDNNFPNLAGNASIWDGPSWNVVSMILGGFQPWHNNQSSMPEYGGSLTDDQIAAVANYVRTSWNNHGTADATGSMVSDERGLASDWVALDTGTTKASVTDGNAIETFDDISGQIEMFGDRENCLLNASFNSTDTQATTKSMQLAGSCANSGGTLEGQVTLDGKVYPVRLETQIYTASGQMDRMRIFGILPESGKMFDARINFVSPAD